MALSRCSTHPFTATLTPPGKNSPSLSALRGYHAGHIESYSRADSHGLLQARLEVVKVVSLGPRDIPRFATGRYGALLNSGTNFFLNAGVYSRIVCKKCQKKDRMVEVVELDPATAGLLPAGQYM